MKKFCIPPKVSRCQPAEDFETSGKWIVTIKDLKTGLLTRETFDGVMAATGHHTEPIIPSFEGQTLYKGQTFHSHQYRDFLQFIDKRVLVVGLGNSGGDIANELSRISSKV